MKKRIQITIEEDLDVKLEEFCEKNHCTKSSIIGLATSEYLTAQQMLPEVLKQVDELKHLMKKLAINNK